MNFIGVSEIERERERKRKRKELEENKGLVGFSVSVAQRDGGDEEEHEW